MCSDFHLWAQIKYKHSRTPKKPRHKHNFYIYIEDECYFSINVLTTVLYCYHLGWTFRDFKYANALQLNSTGLWQTFQKQLPKLPINLKKDCKCSHHVLTSVCFKSGTIMISITQREIIKLLKRDLANTIEPAH